MHARLATERWEAALPSGPAQVKNSPPKNFCKYIPGARLHDSARLRGVVGFSITQARVDTNCQNRQAGVLGKIQQGLTTP